MKLLVKIAFVCLVASYSYSQQTLDLEKIRGAERPNSSVENFYLFKITNKGKASIDFKLVATNTPCKNTNMRYASINHDILDSSKSRKLEKSNIKANESMEFYLKTKRPLNAQTNTWNCTSVVAVDYKNNVISNELVIESLIPDSKYDN